jgi:predicted ATPase
MSDGTLRALGLLTAVFQKPPPSVLVIEEPEATIHPGALGAVLDLLRHASRHRQVIVTTHSPGLLDAPWIEDRHLRMVSWHEEATRVSPVSEASREALRSHLRSGEPSNWPDCSLSVEPSSRCSTATTTVRRNWHL